MSPRCARLLDVLYEQESLRHMTTTLASTWTTDELMAEVLKRSAGDRRALDALSATILRALLAECDRTFPGDSRP